MSLKRIAIGVTLAHFGLLLLATLSPSTPKIVLPPRQLVVKTIQLGEKRPPPPQAPVVVAAPAPAPAPEPEPIAIAPKPPKPKPKPTPAPPKKKPVKKPVVVPEDNRQVELLKRVKASMAKIEKSDDVAIVSTIKVPAKIE